MPHGCSGCASTGFHVTSGYRFNVQVATDRAGIAVLDLRICVKSSTRISDVKQRSPESRKKIMRVLKVSGDGSSEKSETLSR